MHKMRIFVRVLSLVQIEFIIILDGFIDPLKVRITHSKGRLQQRRLERLISNMAIPWTDRPLGQLIYLLKIVAMHLYLNFAF